MPNPTASSRWRQFRNVDATDDAGLLADFLDDIASVPSVGDTKRESLGLLGLHAGQSVLDVGCGTGREVRELARIVGASGRVAGLDSSAQLIAYARASSDSLAPASIEYVVGDAHELPFPAETFDACRADRTLQHLAQPEIALREMVRVVRSGGRVVVTEGGWTLRASALDPDLTNRVLGVLTTGEDDKQWIGYLLPVMFHLVGLAEVSSLCEQHKIHDFDELSRLLNLDRTVAESVAAGVVDPHRADAWVRELHAALRERTAWVDLDMIHLAGVKP